MSTLRPSTPANTTTLDVIASITALAPDAEQRIEALEASPEKIDALGGADMIWQIASLIDDELVDRFPAFRAASRLIDVENVGVSALAMMSVLRMLISSPDLVDLALRRELASLEKNIFGEFGHASARELYASIGLEVPSDYALHNPWEANKR